MSAPGIGGWTGPAAAVQEFLAREGANRGDDGRFITSGDPVVFEGATAVVPPGALYWRGVRAHALAAGLARASTATPNPFVRRHKPINYIFDDFARYGEWTISMVPEDDEFRFELNKPTTLESFTGGKTYVPGHRRRFLALTPQAGFGAAKIMADAFEYGSLNSPPRGDGDLFLAAWTSLLGFLDGCGWDYGLEGGLDFAATVEEHWIPLRGDYSYIGWFYDQPAEFRKAVIDRAKEVGCAVLEWG